MLPTPMGLKAMKELQDLNPRKDTATNSMIMFLVLNTSGTNAYSNQYYGLQSTNRDQPTDIFISHPA